MNSFNCRIILGSAQFGMDYGINNPKGKISYDESLRILEFAFENGIRELDTASVYGDSENLIGVFINQNPLKVFKINTKISSKHEPLESQLEKSMENLCVSKIHKLIFHSLDIYNHFKPCLAKFYLENKGKYFDQIGVSVYENSEIEFLLKEKHIDVIQAPFNLFDNYNQRGEIYNKVKSKSIALDIRSIFLQGLLFMNEEELPKMLRPFYSNLLKLKNIKKRSGIDIQKLAYGYVNSFEFFDQILIGVDCLDHLKKNLNDISFKLPKNLKNEIEQIEVDDIKLLNIKNWKK